MYLNQFNRYCGWLISKLTWFSLLSASVLTSFYLSVMRVEPFLQGGIAVAGVFFAICSVLYARATLNFDSEQKKKLAMEAAEDSFMGTLLAIVYFATSSVIFFTLYDSGNYPEVEGKLTFTSPLLIPMIWAYALHGLLATPACVKLMNAIDKTTESWAVQS